MITASPWKNFLLELSESVGTRLSAASSRSVATLLIFALLGRLGRLGRFGRFGRLGMFANVVGNDIPSGPLVDDDGDDDGAEGTTAPMPVATSADVAVICVGSVEMFVVEDVDVPEEGTAASLMDGNGCRGRYLRDLASWRFQPAMLMLPNNAQ